MDALVSYHWPGNVRELENVIERAVILSRGSTLTIDDCLDIVPVAEMSSSNSKMLEDVERSHIIKILEETNWVIHGKRGAASVLGMNPGTLRSKMKKLGIKKPQSNNDESKGARSWMKSFTWFPHLPFFCYILSDLANDLLM